MKNSKTAIIAKFGLTPHPEGGYFKETYRSDALTSSDGKERNVSTAIYYLLEGDDFSAFHRIQSDEMWHFYSGDTLEIVEITTDGVLKHHLLGTDYSANIPQVVIPAGSWFAAHLPKKNALAFVGCTVAPGFDFEDFEMAQQEDLLMEYPDLEPTIRKFTRE